MSDETQNVNSFHDLQLASELGAIPLQRIMRISLNSLRREQSDLEVYEFVFTKALLCFDPDQFESGVSVFLFPELIKHVDKLVVELKDDALSYFVADNIKMLLQLANMLAGFLEYVSKVSEMIQLYQTVPIFLEFLARGFGIVKYAAHQQTESYKGLQQLLSVCLGMRPKVMDLLLPSEKGRYFRNLEDTQEYDCLKRVIILLGKIASEADELGRNLSDAVLQSMFILTSKHVKYLKTNDTVWLHLLIVAINDEIKTMFQKLMQQSESREQQMWRLKRMNLMWRVLLKLFSLIRADEFTRFEHLLSTIITVKNALLTAKLDQDLADTTHQNMTSVCESLVGLSFRSPTFAKVLTSLDYHSAEEIDACLSLHIQVIRRLVKEDSVDCLDTYTCRHNIISACTNLIRKGHCALNRQSDLFRKLLVVLCAFIAKCLKNPPKARQEVLEDTLVGMILQDSYWVATLGLDVWSFYVRIQEKLQWSYFIFWKTINDQFPVYTAESRAIFARRLLRNIFLFLPKSMQRKIYEDFPVARSKNFKLWIAIRLGNVDRTVADSWKNKLRHFLNIPQSATLEAIYDALHSILLIGSVKDREFFETVSGAVISLSSSIKLADSVKVSTYPLLHTIGWIVQDLRASNSKELKSLALQILSEVDKHRVGFAELLLFDLTGSAPKSGVLVKALATSVRQRQLGPAVIQDNESYKVSRLAHQNERVYPEHQCHSSKVLDSSITQHINDQIDELISDDEEEFDAFSEWSPVSKKLKPDFSSTQYETVSSASSAINSINQQLIVLQQLQHERALDSDHVERIKQISNELNQICDNY